MFPSSKLFNRKGKVYRRQETFGLKKKVFMLTVLILVSAAFLLVPVSLVMGQVGVEITAISPSSVSVSSLQAVTVNVKGTFEHANSSYRITLGDVSITGTSDGYSVNDNLTVVTIPGKYIVTLQDVTNSTISATSDDPFTVEATGLAAIPIATALIMLVAVTISFANMGLNRLLITKMIGWHEYRSMQKEMSEYNSQRMAALRAKDTKTLERLKKKESQITAMQGKMFKPQLVLIPITFIYLVIWPVLVGYFPFAVAYVPGLGAQPFFIWYLLCSFFFGTIASRVIGVTPIQ